MLHPKEHVVCYLWLFLWSIRAHWTKCWQKFTDSGRVDPLPWFWNHLSGKHATTCSPRGYFERKNRKKKKRLSITLSHTTSDRLVLLASSVIIGSVYSSKNKTIILSIPKSLGTNACFEILLYTKVIKKQKNNFKC